MRLQIPFCHLASLSKDGAERPTAALRLPLEDEVQYRLAGYIESMVERCAEEQDERGKDQEESEHSDADKSDREDDDDGDKTSKGKKKKAANDSNHRHKPQGMLSTSYCQPSSPELRQPTMKWI